MVSVSTVAALYSLTVTGLAVGLVVLLHFLESEFDPSWRVLSEYSLGRYGVLMRAAFLAWGTGGIAVAVALSESAWPWSLGLAPVAIGAPRRCLFRHRPDHHATHRDVEEEQCPRRVWSVVHPRLPGRRDHCRDRRRSRPSCGACSSLGLGRSLARARLVPRDEHVVRPHDGNAGGGPEVRIGWPNRASMVIYLGWVSLAAATMLRRPWVRVAGVMDTPRAGLALCQVLDLFSGMKPAASRSCPVLRAGTQCSNVRCQRSA